MKILIIYRVNKKEKIDSITFFTNLFYDVFFLYATYYYQYCYNPLKKFDKTV